jgi:hypothetical protein
MILTSLLALSGDFSVKYDSTRIFSIFYIYLCVLTFTVAFNNVLDEMIDLAIVNQAVALEEKFLGSDEKCADWISGLLSGSDEHGEARCSKEAFMISIMSELCLRCTPKNISVLNQKFSSFDSNSKGYLTKQDLESFVSDWLQVRAMQSDSTMYKQVGQSAENPLTEGIEMTSSPLDRPAKGLFAEHLTCTESQHQQQQQSVCDGCENDLNQDDFEYL